MVEINCRIDGTSVTLDCAPSDLDPVNIEDRIQQVLPLLKRLLDADVAFGTLPEPILEKRYRGIAAQSMKVEAAILSTVLQAELLASVIAGRESISDHGFPEFDDE